MVTTKLVKETPYDTKLTVASSENLELLTGDVFMTDGSETPATQTPYKLVTTDIESVSEGGKGAGVPRLTLTGFTNVDAIQSSGTGCAIEGTLVPNSTTPSEYANVMTELNGNVYPGYLTQNFNNSTAGGFEGKGTCGWYSQLQANGTVTFDYQNGPGQVFIATGSQTSTVHNISGDVTTTSLSTTKQYDVLAIELSQESGTFTISPSTVHDYFGLGILRAEDYGLQNGDVSKTAIISCLAMWCSQKNPGTCSISKNGQHMLTRQHPAGRVVHL